MGFRILRDDSPQYKDRIDQLTIDKIEEEAKRWCVRTHRTDEENKAAQDHLNETLKNRKGEESIEEILDNVKETIETKRPSLDMVQGQLDIEKVMALLE